MTAGSFIRGNAAIVDWHDGDTAHGVMDLGDGLAWGASIRLQFPADVAQVRIVPQRFRIAGFSAPELKAEGGTYALDCARELVPPGMYLIRRYGLDKWRRPLVDIELPNGMMFSEAMLNLKTGRPISISDQLLAA